MPLPVAVGAREHRDAARWVDAHGGRFVEASAGAQRTDEARRRDAASLDVAAHADAPELALRLCRRLARREARVIGELQRFVQRGFVVARVVDHRNRRLIGELARLDHVLPAEFRLIHAQLLRGLAHEAFHDEGRFRPAGTPIGIDGHGVREHGLHIDVDRGRRVLPREQRAMQPGRNAGREGRQVGAQIGERVAPEPNRLAVRVHRQFRVRDVVAAMRIRHERFAALGNPPDGPSDAGAGPGHEGFFGIVEDLRAKAAADVGCIDPELVLRDAENEGAHQEADHVRVLARGVERILARRQIVVADCRARLHRVRDQPVIDEVDLGDVGRAGECGVGGGLVAKLPIVAEVILCFLVHGCAAALDRLLHVHDRRQLFQVELHKLGRILGLIESLGDDRDDWIAHMPHLACRKDRMLGLLHRLPVAAGNEPPARHAASARGIDFLMREHRDNARRRFGRRGVYGNDARMRDR